LWLTPVVLWAWPLWFMAGGGSYKQQISLICLRAGNTHFPVFNSSTHLSNQTAF
jgi:hypothetical protein